MQDYIGQVNLNTIGPFFSCPFCKLPFNKNYVCERCSDKKVEVFESLPLLVKNFSIIRSQIEEAKLKGRADWYESSQEPMWQGPYRHHLLKRKNYVESVFRSYLSEKKIISLLDLGCGDGANFNWLKPFTHNLYGSDYNVVRLLRAKKRDIATEVALADVTDYPTQENSFDAIFFNHVLEHIPRDDLALSELYRILKPGGICVLGVPNEGAFWWQLAYRLQPHSLKTTDHVHFYTVSTLTKKLENVGFKIRNVKRLGWGIPHWDWDSRLRGYKILDDFFELFGKILLPNQASSLYFIIEKKEH